MFKIKPENGTKYLLLSIVPLVLTLLSLSGLIIGYQEHKQSIERQLKEIIAIEETANRIFKISNGMESTLDKGRISYNSEYRKKYSEYHLQMERAFQNVRKFSDSKETDELESNIQAAETRIAIEQAALERLEAGEAFQAQALLSTPDYKATERVFSTIVDNMLEEIEDISVEINREESESLSRILWTVLVGTAVLIATWGFMFSILNTWQKLLIQKAEELAQLNKSLDEKVLEQTKELRLYNKRLKESNFDLENFAAIASHDLQEPLRKIITFGAQLTEEYSGQLDENGKFYIDRMTSSAIRMRDLINDLLAYSRVIRKGSPAEELDLSETIKYILQDLELKIREKNATVHVGKLGHIEADPTQIRQVFQNLISNALKFQKPGVAPAIHIEAVENKPEEGYVEITVKDNGIGFDEKYLERIFTIFKRLHGRREYEGSGIGLAVCRRIINRHNGHITASSTPNEGSLFIIQLPINQQNPLESSEKNMTELVQQKEEENAHVCQSA